MDFSADILIYIQSVKNFFENNENIRKYFLTNVDNDLFFENLGQIAEINLIKNGEPQLSKEQFEVLRLSLQIFKKVDDEVEMEETIYEYTSNNIKFHLK